MGLIRSKLMVAIITLAASAAAGLAVQGWPGIFIWPLTLCVIVVVLAFVRLVINVVVSVRRTRARVGSIQKRLRLLSTDQLCEVMRTPANPDSQFALVELMRRGVDARPTKEQLFGMLTSGNPRLCMDAMTNLEMFYPELSIPDGASNLDQPDVWQSRVEVFRKAG